MKRLADQRWTFQGFSDHLVSEAIYLADPDENGIELYCDRPKEQWKLMNGQIVMATEPLDVDNLMEELGKPEQPGDKQLSAIDIGHVHLHVADLAQVENFYHQMLGFDITQRSYPGALFLSAGGYHHHIGTNIWAGKGAPAPPKNAVGLLSFRISVPDRYTVEIIRNRLEHSGVETTIKNDGGAMPVLVTHDYDGTGVEISADYE